MNLWRQVNRTDKVRRVTNWLAGEAAISITTSVMVFARQGIRMLYPINISIHAKLFQVSKAALSSRDVGLLSFIIIFFLLFLCLPDRSFVHSHPLHVASGRGSVLWMIQLGRSGASAPSPAKHLLFFLFLHIDWNFCCQAKNLWKSYLRYGKRLNPNT